MKIWTMAAVIAGILLAHIVFAGGAKEGAKPEATEQTGTGEVTIYATLADYERDTGKSIRAFGEAPMLQTKVASGELPPVEQRLPEEPLVIAPSERIGRYGGELRIAEMTATLGWEAATAREQPLIKTNSDFDRMYPNVAKGWDLSDDYQTLTIYLRKGMKWSDGAPFSAGDLMFWFEDFVLNDELSPVKPKPWKPGGRLPEFDRVDDLTVRIRFAAPYPPILNRLAVNYEGFEPKHYLKQYHIKYNPKAEEIAKQEGYDNWWQCYKSHRTIGAAQQDTNLPTTNTWILENFGTDQKVFARNPYFWQIDTAGNQLPYIDRQMVYILGSMDVVNMKTISGELSYSAFNTLLDNYTLYKEGEAKGEYHTMLWGQPFPSSLGLSFNLTHKDPVLREIFNDLRFRQAMSIAMDREEINKAAFFGKGTPRQGIIGSECSFYEDWWGDYYAEYDPDKANGLLDEMGLAWDDAKQFRLRPDGQTLAVTIEYPPGQGPKGKVCELVKEYWEKTGVKVAVKAEDRSLYFQRGRANEFDVGAFQKGGNGWEPMAFMNPALYRARWGVKFSGVPWELWYNTGGAKGEEPPQEIKELFDLCDKWQTTLPGTEEYARVGKQLMEANLKGLYEIGTVGLVRHPVIFKNNLKNTPLDGIYIASFWKRFRPAQWYFAQ